MNKINKKVIIGSIIALVAVVVAVIVIVCVLPKDNITPEINAQDLTVEFDGTPHKIEASASEKGSLTYEYIGIDNEYRSVLEPTQAGEYDVEISFKPFNSDMAIVNKKVKLTITLPYTIDESGSELSAYVGQQQNVVLPSTYKNKTITALADNTFKDSNIISVKMPNTEFEVNPNAFNGCIVKKLIIHESTKLLDGQYPNGLELVFYDNPKTIFNDTFGEITGIEELNLPLTIKELEADALSKIKVNKLSLYSNLSLKDKNLSATIRAVKVNTDMARTLADSFFENCEGIEKIEIDEGIDSFGAKAFYNCTSLSELIVNSYHTTIGENCFKEDFILKKLTFKEGLNLNELGLKTIEMVQLKNCESLTVGQFENCTALNKIILPNTLKAIATNAFSGCSNLSEVVFPENLETIEYCAFKNCTSLISLTIPKTTTTILDGAFEGCTSLKTINIPQGITKICNSTFWNCDSLETISLPNSVLAIDSYAFSGCSSLKNIDLSENLESIGRFAFLDCYGLTEITLPAKVKSIGINVFSGCNWLTKITFLSTTMPKFDGNIFNGYVVSDRLIYVPSSLLSSYKVQFPNYNFAPIPKEA